VAEQGRGARDASFDRYARMVRRALRVPVALVSIVEANRQVFPGAEGLPEPYQVARETPLSHSFCQYVVKDEQPVVVADAARDPRVADNLEVEDLGVAAYLGWPLFDHDGRAIGALCAIDHVPREWTPEDLAALEDLAGACSAELSQRELRRSERAESTHAAELADQALAQLAMSEELTSTTTLESIVDAIADTTTRILGCERAGIWLDDDLMGFVDEGSQDVRPERPVPSAGPQSLVHVPGTRAWPAAEAYGRIAVDDSTPAGAVFAIGLPAYFADRAEQARYYPATSPAATDGEARAVVPMWLGSRVWGCLVLTWPEARPFEEEERVTIAALASYAALAVQRSLLWQERVDATSTLQSAMVTELPTVPGLSVAARYRPAARRELVGGDWYDVLTLSSGSVAAVIGDVIGHDMEAAADMGQLRSILRAIAWSGDRGPAQTVSALDRALEGLGLSTIATLLYAELTPPTSSGPAWAVRWASAGHPPALVVGDDGAVRWLRGDAQAGHGPLLGAGAEPAEWTDGRAELRPGETLLLYTDGLVERRGEPLDTGLARLEQSAATPPGAPQELIDRLLGAIVPKDAMDDVACLAVRVDRAEQG
jgi:serine phosphatase RsbU (regulator of sigma subunit)